MNCSFSRYFYIRQTLNYQTEFAYFYSKNRYVINLMLIYPEILKQKLHFHLQLCCEVLYYYFQNIWKVCIHSLCITIPHLALIYPKCPCNRYILLKFSLIYSTLKMKCSLYYPFKRTLKMSKHMICEGNYVHYIY